MLRPALPRSYLYVPGTRPDWLARARDRVVDAVVADLEDAVPPADKDRARLAVARWLAAGTAAPGAAGPASWVRINADDPGTDLAAVVGPTLSGVFVPKAEPELLAEVDGVLTAQEHRRGLPAGQVAVVALLETARGLLRAERVAGMPRVSRLGIGEVDLAADIGLRPGPESAELRPVRVQVAVASAAAGIARPVGPTSTQFRDLDAFRRGAEELLRLGFRARTAIHPDQVPVIHDVFTPSIEQLAAAREVIARFEAAGGAPVTDNAGRLVDLAVVRNAREVLATAGG